jgi:hypothetical protein
MTNSKFEAIAAFPNAGHITSNTDDEKFDAMRDEFATLDFNHAEVRLLSSQFMMHAIHYGDPDELFYYVWSEPNGIFGASVWGSELVPERIEEIRIEPRKVIEHRYFRAGKDAPVGTRVAGLAEQDVAANTETQMPELNDIVNIISTGAKADIENTDTAVNMIVHPRSGNVATMECVVTAAETGESESYFIMVAAENTKNR